MSANVLEKLEKFHKYLLRFLVKIMKSGLMDAQKLFVLKSHNYIFGNMVRICLININICKTLEIFVTCFRYFGFSFLCVHATQQKYLLTIVALSL